jgi:hypothetical protein
MSTGINRDPAEIQVKNVDPLVNFFAPPPPLSRFCYKQRDNRNSKGLSIGLSKPFFAFIWPRIAFNFSRRPDCQIYSLVNRQKAPAACRTLTTNCWFSKNVSRRLAAELRPQTLIARAIVSFFIRPRKTNLGVVIDLTGIYFSSLPHETSVGHDLSV